jgi:AraC-like DNA-binding protein
VRRTAAQIEDDARGIVDPHVLAELVHFMRYAPSRPLDGLVDRFWAVRWAFPGGRHHDQQVLTHPCGNVIVTLEPDGRLSAVLSGLARRVTTRRLSGGGWAVAAMTTPGGLGALLPGRADAVTDRVLPLGPALDVETGTLLDAVGSAPDEAARVVVLERWLIDIFEARAPERLAAARDVVRIARLPESDRSLRRLDDLARAAGTTPRTLQRTFSEYVGVSPTWVLRRYRLLEATERARAGREVSWAQVAADLGYADQAHLVRDVKAHLGTTPAAYAARLG